MPRKSAVATRTALADRAPSPREREQVRRVATRAQLEQVVLIELACKRKPAPPKADGKLQVSYQTDEKHALVAEGRRIDVWLRFTAATSPNIYEVRAIFVLTYRLTEKTTAAEAAAFARRNAAFSAWPYWRELVQSSVSRMGFQAPTVPLLRL